MEQQIQLNEHNKTEYPPMHTTEHIVNQTMIRLFGCGRSISAHIERKKSKLDYRLESCPTPQEIEQLEKKVNEVIASHPARHHRIYHTRRSTRPFRLGAPALPMPSETVRVGQGRGLRRMPVHRAACSQYVRNRHV